MLVDFIKTFPQRFIPSKIVTKLLGACANSCCTAFKNLLITLFIKVYKVDLSEAIIQDINNYKSFNDFFTRKLLSHARPIASDELSIVSPADGAFSEVGVISKQNFICAKAHNFSVEELLAGDNELADNFQEGYFATIYLSPRDYHRVHMPFTGRLKKMTYVPGTLFSVNEKTVQMIPKVFARNERLVVEFETSCGPMIMVFVGAMIVASINTIWHGQINRDKTITTWDYSDNENQIVINKGDEVGHFELGSTVILLFPQQANINWDQMACSGSETRYGQQIAKMGRT